MNTILAAWGRALQRWWRSRSLAAQLVLTNLAVVAIWAGATRQILTLQSGRRNAAEEAASVSAAAVLVTAQIDPALVNLATGQRDFTAPEETP